MTSIKEKTYRLKYRYLLDTEPIVSKIIQENDLLHSEDIFPLIFKEIFASVRRYLPYLNYKTMDTFFGKSDFDVYAIKGYKYIMENALKNHCIVQGFIDMISADNSESLVRLTGAQNNTLHTGYYTNTKSIPLDISDDFPSPQYWNQYYKRYKKHKEEYYSYKLLNSFAESKNEKISVPKYLSNFAGFLFSNSATFGLDRSIIAAKEKDSFSLTPRFTNNFLKNYFEMGYNLKYKAIKYSTNLIDHLFVDMFAEKYYAFKSTTYISDIVEQIKSGSLEWNCCRQLSELDSKIFKDILEEFYFFPNSYSRDFFLKYALFSFKTTKHFDGYFTKPKDESTGMTVINKGFQSSSIEENMTGMNLILRFIRALNNIVFPLLNDVWDVVIHQINIAKENIITLNTYKNYIQENYSEITADYNLLQDSDIIAIGKNIYDSKGNFDTLLIKCTPDNSVFSNPDKLHHETRKFCCSLLSSFFEKNSKLWGYPAIPFPDINTTSDHYAEADIVDSDFIQNYIYQYYNFLLRKTN